MPQCYTVSGSCGCIRNSITAPRASLGRQHPEGLFIVSLSNDGLMKRNMHLDDLLSKWAFDPSTLNVRLVKGNDGRDVIQMRVDMGVLQLETTGRPDGELAHDHQSMLEFLQEESLKHADRDLTEDECMEVDREFMQFYHRRICWLRL